jgi:hypothetical protein
MNSNLDVNLGTIPLANAIVYSVLILAALAIAFLFVRWLLTKSGVNALGGFKIKKEQQGLTTMHNMDEDSKDSDDAMKTRMRQFTNTMANRILDAFGEYHLCAMTKRALAAAIRFPLYESVNNNHFTKELMPDRFDNYRQRILDQIREEYTGVFLVFDDFSCTKGDKVPSWATASVLIEQLLDTWLKNTCIAQQDCSQEKADTYTKYRAGFAESDDEYRTKIADECIAKNERYITELMHRVMLLDNEMKGREERIRQLTPSASDQA